MRHKQVRAYAPAGDIRRRTLVLGGLVSGLAAACSPREPVKIGFIGGTSGRYSDLGVGGRRGAELAVEDLNRAGGLSGREVSLIARDDEQNDSIAIQRLQELIDLGVSFVVGPMTSSVAKALVPIANQRRVPLIAPSAGTHELSGVADYFFRVLPDTRVSARRQAEGLVARGHRRLVTVADMKNRAFSKAWADVVAEHFSAGGGQRVGTVEFEAIPGLAFTEVARQAVAARGDVIMIAASATDSSVLAQQIRRLDDKVAFALSAWAGTEQLPMQAGRALDGAQVPQFFDRNSQASSYLDFVRRFTERFGESPGYQATNAYDCTTLGVSALRQGTSGELISALRAISRHPGLQREIILDANGDCASPVFLTELRDGRYVMVER